MTLQTQLEKIKHTRNLRINGIFDTRDIESYI